MQLFYLTIVFLIIWHNRLRNRDRVKTAYTSLGDTFSNKHSKPTVNSLSTFDSQSPSIGTYLQFVLIKVADVELDLVLLAAVGSVLNVALVQRRREWNRGSAGGHARHVRKSCRAAVVVVQVGEAGRQIGHARRLLLLLLMPLLGEEVLAPPLAAVLELLHALLDAVRFVVHAAHLEGRVAAVRRATLKGAVPAVGLLVAMDHV